MSDDEGNKTVIGKNTQVTIGVILALGGGIGWLNNLKFQGDANANSLTSIEQRQIQYERDIKRVEKWLAAIGQRLGIREPRE
jgi:hypothetical protein